MRPMRQNIQLTLPFTWDSPGESGGAHEEGTEVRAAQPETELPARSAWWPWHPSRFAQVH